MDTQPEITENERIDLANLNDLVFDMFFAQNTLIDMDFRHTMDGMLASGDEQMQGDLATYAEKIEEFLKYATEHPDRLARSIALLKGNFEQDDPPAH